jgi:uncharacterized protein YecT (DUF1311 family)
VSEFQIIHDYPNPPANVRREFASLGSCESAAECERPLARSFVRMMQRSIFVVLAMLVVAGPAAADSAPDPCKTPKSMIDVTICEGSLLAEADRDLNVTFQLLLKKLGPQQAKRLRAAEKTWMTYRDETCNTESQMQACDDDLSSCGTDVRVLYPSCLREVTQARTRRLKALIAFFTSM